MRNDLLLLALFCLCNRITTSVLTELGEQENGKLRTIRYDSYRGITTTSPTENKGRRFLVKIASPESVKNKLQDYRQLGITQSDWTGG